MPVTGCYVGNPQGLGDRQPNGDMHMSPFSPVGFSTKNGVPGLWRQESWLS